MKVLQLTYTRVLAFIIMMMVGGNCWAANLNGTIKYSPEPYRENCMLTDNLTIQGTSTVVVITGNLDLNGKSLVVKSGATLIIEGNLNVTSRGSLSVDAGGVTIVKNTCSGSGTINVNAAGSVFAVLNKYNQLIFWPHGNHTGEDNIYVANKDGYNDETKQAYKTAMETMSKNASLLPISLTSFTASQNGEEIEIAWTTNSEVNNDYFTVEYSIDGVSFKTLEIVAGSGTTSEVNDYTVATQASLFNGVVYFRLKQTDYNGEYSYSDVITLAVESSNELYVYPNPATEYVSVSGMYKTAIVQDMFGKKVAVATNGEQIFVGNLSAGMYYVVITTENGKKILSFVKE